MKKSLTVYIFILFTCFNCFGQSTYKGLTPGKSTKAEVGQVLGLPVKSLSETLIEYKFAEAGGKAYVQYRDLSIGAGFVSVSPSSTAISPSCGIGWVDAGKWPAGSYLMELFVEGRKVAAASFDVY